MMIDPEGGGFDRPAESVPVAPKPSLPWSLRASWLGLGLGLPAVLISTLAVELIRDVRIKDAVALTAYELAIVVPVIVILMSRKAGWKSVGFRPFTLDNLALGCGLLVATYMAIIIHNTILLGLGVPTQAESMRMLLEMTESPWGIALGGVIVAPVVEEIVFRGFFFQGLREAYGSKKAILVSSLVFAAMHLQPEAFIPTFILGCTLAYVFDKANSIWPGALLHLLVNFLGIGSVMLMTMFPGAL
jgi:membrane protease YdiL (CAAX protease family)